MSEQGLSTPSPEGQLPNSGATMWRAEQVDGLVDLGRSVEDAEKFHDKEMDYVTAWDGPQPGESQTAGVEHSNHKEDETLRYTDLRGGSGMEVYAYAKGVRLDVFELSKDGKHKVPFGENEYRLLSVEQAKHIRDNLDRVIREAEEDEE